MRTPLLLLPEFKMKDVLILDFYDSFTYNIASVLSELDLSSEVIGYDKINSYPYHKIIILGPGPGRPSDYKEIQPLIKKLLKDENKYLMGICLGHQLIWDSKGYKIEKSSNPLHGHQTSTIIPKWPEFPKSLWGKKVSVQRYNSLAVKNISHDPDLVCEGAEMLMGRFSNGISYQFHPESVGTPRPLIFFGPLRKLCRQKSDLMESTI